MRYVFDINGNNVTSNVQAALFSAKVLPLADLFWFQYVDPGNAAAGTAILLSNKFMTSGPQPVKVNVLQNQPGPLGTAVINATYQPARIKRGALNYEIGFGDQTCEVTWYTDDSQSLSNVPWGFKWALVAGYMDECPVWIHRAFFTPSTDSNLPATLLGTTLMWRGFIREVKADRGQIVITLGSLMHIFQNTQVPTQAIEPGNRFPPFYTGTVQLFGNSLTGITPLVTCTPLDLQFTLSAGYPADHALRDAYFSAHQQPPPNGWTPQSNTPAPALYRIRDNITNNTPVANTLHVYPYEPIDPVSLVLGITPLGSARYMEIFYQSALTGGALGFPYVPPPEVSF